MCRVDKESHLSDTTAFENGQDISVPCMNHR